MCAGGWLGSTDCAAAGHPPWWTEEGMREEQERYENGAFVFVANVSLIKME